MSAVRRLMPCAVALASLALALPAQAAPKKQSARGHETWITMPRWVAEKAQGAYAAAGRSPLVFEGEGDTVVTQLREADVPFLAEKMHEELRHCGGGFTGHASRDAAFDRAAWENRPAEERVVPGPRSGYTIDNAPVANALVNAVQETNIRATITTLAAFSTRHHNCATGNQSALAIRDMWQGLATAAGRTDVTVALFNHSGYTTQQPSVIVTIPGTSLGTVAPDEVIVFGAHQDSIVSGSCGRSPGADDDASGIATITEVLRVALAKGFRPLRTVKFMAYAAEEVGLRGSGQIAQSFATATPRVNVVGVIHFDMTNYTTSPQHIYLIGDRTDATQNTFVGQLIDTYLPGVTRGTTFCNYACSDHASWTAQGYPSSFPFEANFNPPPAGDNPFIHTANDTLAQSGNNANHALRFAKLGAAYLAEAAKGYLTNPAGLGEEKVGAGRKK
jgi:bacterial leucyl aminopeptidase